jgi:HEAT repeat protein
LATRHDTRQTRLRLVSKPADPGNLLAQGLVDLHKAVKGAAFYPVGHPYRTEPLQRAYEALRQLVAQRELVLTVNRKGFVPGGEEGEWTAMILQLAHECFIRRIASITFMSDLLLDDLALFVDLLSGDPYKTSHAGGFGKQLEEAGARTVWVNEKDLAAIWAKRSGESAPSGVPHGEGEAAAVDSALAEGAAEAMDRRETRSVKELLQLMAVEKHDARYQELGRELVEICRDAAGDLPIQPLLEELLRQQNDPQKSLPQKEYAHYILERLAEGAADRLMDLLESREHKNKEGLVRVLGALGVKGAYWMIQRLCLAEGVYERKAHAAALVRLGPPALAPVVAMLKDQRWYVVRNMATILGGLRCQEAILPLKRALYHHDIRVRKETVRALMKIGGESAEHMLIALLDDADDVVVKHVILSLGLMKSRQAVPVLLRLLDRRDLFLKSLPIKKELVGALGRIGDRRATVPLLKMLGTKGWPVIGRWLELKIAVAFALGSLGDEAAIPALRALTRRPGPLSEACLEALDALEGVSGGSDDD